MSRKNFVSAWKSDDEDEVSVPALCRTIFWMSRLLGIAPVRLWRANGRWQLAVSPSLALMQRVIVVITGITSISGALSRLVVHHPHKTAQPRIGFAVKVFNVLYLSLAMFAYAIGCWRGTERLKEIISVLKQTQKINTGLNLEKNMNRFQQNGFHAKLIVYIIWLILTSVEDFSWSFILRYDSGDSVLVLCLYATFYYQSLMVQMLRLQWSAKIMELQFTLNLLNDELEHFLLTPSMASEETRLKIYLNELVPQKLKRISYSVQADTSEPKHDTAKQRIEDLNHYHEEICDLVTKVNQQDGFTLLFSFLLIFLQLMLSPLNLILDIAHAGPVHSVRQLNLVIVYVSQLLILVEPCHRLRDQMDRTRALLSRALWDDVTTGHDPSQFDLFVLQVQMRCAALAPMGVFTVSRPLVTSVIGGAVTYLTIVLQAQNEQVIRV